ncbi:hypothetical protein FRC08_018925 [Ceratobasidium sp. 394]|nr:hypothetical protein FRC08_018925 [Ceratobasidium sp. 394]
MSSTETRVLILNPPPRIPAFQPADYLYPLNLSTYASEVGREEEEDFICAVAEAGGGGIKVIAANDVPDQEKAALAQSDVPEGGLTAWMTVAGSWLILFCTFGYLNAYGVFQDYYVREYMTNKTTSVISWIGSTQLCLLFMMGLVSGKLFDMGYFHWCIGFGSLLYVFCA